jgi:hypothetical protein
MNGKERHWLARLRLNRVALVLIIALLGSFVSVLQAEAVLTAQSISGTVEVLLAGEQTWKPLTAAMKLKTGDQVRTAQSSSVDLWFEDGSVLNLAEETQMSINQLEISTARKSRIARFKLWWGAITAKVTKLAFAENVCEIETDTVVAGVKFSEMTVIHPRNSNQAEVIAHQGLVEVRQVADGMATVTGFFNEQESLTFLLDSIGARVLIGVQKIVGKITLQSNIPLRNIRGMIDGGASLLKIDNTGRSPIDVGLQEIVVTLEQQVSATFGIPPGREMMITSNAEIDASFSIKRRSAILCSGLYIFLNSGALDVAGETVKAGIPNCFPLEGAPKTRGVIQREEERDILEKIEEVGTPSIIESEQSRGADLATPTPIPLEPTPTPTPEDVEGPLPYTPTPTQTPEEEEEEEEDRPTGPICPSCPRPAPTETPASPSETTEP